MLTKTIAVFALAGAACFAQYKMEPAGAVPADVPAAFASELQKDGAKVIAGNGKLFCEVWLAASAKSGPKSSEEGVTFATVAHGALLGVIRFPERGEDRRGQMIKGGIYTLRYSQHPVNGDHLGVAPQRDFAVLTPIAEDRDPKASPNFEALMAMSRKASGTPHPAVLSIWSSGSEAKPGFEKQGDSDWVWNAKIGSEAVSIVLAGRSEH